MISIALYYKSVFNKNVIEVIFFNNEGKLNKVVVYYTN